MNNSQLLDYLLRLIGTGQELPATADELPAPWNQRVKALSKVRQPLPESGVRQDITQFHHRSFSYAMRINGASEEAQRAAANRLYYAVLTPARYRFGEDLQKGHNSHNNFAAHMLREAVDYRTISLATLLKWEDARWTLYDERIRADYDQAIRFAFRDRDSHVKKATMLFNALSTLKRAEESPAT